MYSPLKTCQFKKSKENGLIAVVQYLLPFLHCHFLFYPLSCIPNVLDFSFLDNYYKVNFPADNNGLTCYHDIK